MTTRIKLGYMLDFRNPHESRLSFSDFYDAMFRQIDFVESAGLDSIWLTEHHFTDDGYLSAIMPTLSAIAARTKRITLGTYVLLAPFYHPLRLAEDAAVIDVISHGRLRLGIGMGYRAEEFDGFEVSQKTRLSRTLETIEIMKRAWTGEVFSFEGKHFKFRDVRVLPRPVSKPHPELLWGGMTDKAIERGAELGLSFACNLGAREVALYRKALQERGKNPVDFSIVQSRLLYIAETPEQAWDDIRDAAMYQAELYGKWLSANIAANQDWIRPDPEKIKRAALLGPPELIAESLAKVLDAGAMTELILNMQLPGLEPAKAMRSLERFVSEVMPRLPRS